MEGIDKFKKQLKETQEFTDEIESFLDNNFLVDGKTIDAWRRRLFVKIPEKLNFQSVIQLGADISAKYQLAARYRDRQAIQLAILERTKSDKYNAAYQAARKENEVKFKKPLAADSCKIAANIEVKDLENAIGNQKIIKDWWKATCDTLTEVRKLVETILRALGNDVNAEKDYVVVIKKEDRKETQDEQTC
ncbi:MAG: hypothetical protein DRH90_13140 [Deltaproteobacteria bacterium]|nr:MAG: hypothetical protein DRH90_13140 [Deltaproteobacteria bacterium]RLC18206.1 MAG: hypothetical protein DRI24_03685 [Deltaproteobacteria bacterium]